MLQELLAGTSLALKYPLQNRIPRAAAHALPQLGDKFLLVILREDRAALDRLVELVIEQRVLRDVAVVVQVGAGRRTNGRITLVEDALAIF